MEISEREQEVRDDLSEALEYVGDVDVCRLIRRITNAIADAREAAARADERAKVLAEIADSGARVHRKVHEQIRRLREDTTP